MRAILLIVLAACGPVSYVLPPNTVVACDRAIECKAVQPADRVACIKCAEHIDPKIIEEAGDIGPLENVECSTMQAVVWLTDFHICMEQRWYGGR